MEFAENFVIKAPTLTVWEFLTDPNEFCSTVPGAELVRIIDEKSFLSNMVVKLGIFRISVQTKSEYVEVVPPYRLKIVNSGTESKMLGGVSQKVEVLLETIGECETKVSIHISTTVTGRLATFGDRIARGKARELAREFVQAVKNKLEDKVLTDVSNTISSL